MKSFSQRQGIVPVKNVIQKDWMSDSLRTRLWNLLVLFFWKPEDELTDSYLGMGMSAHMKDLTTLLWMLHFEKPIDEIGDRWLDARNSMKCHFFGCSWYQVYDFIEFIAQNYDNDFTVDDFVETCNGVLKEELSAYRFVGREIVPITSEQEIEAVDQALQSSPSPVEVHLKRALELFSDRTAPDYRNSIKESISAVEALCSLIAGRPKAQLGEALKTIENTGRLRLHGALREAFSKLYGYTSDADGIRHAMLEGSNIDSEDAKFMLVACSAFVNYLVEKATKAGMKLQFPS